MSYFLHQALFSRLVRISVLFAAFAFIISVPSYAATKFDFGGSLSSGSTPMADYVYYQRLVPSWAGFTSGSAPGSFGISVVGSFAGDPPASEMAPADYNGDGFTDFAVFNAGAWTIHYSGVSGGVITGVGASVSDTLGGAGDIPQSANFTGSANAELAVYNPVTADWSIKPVSGSPLPSVHFGTPFVDKPVTEDYDGDGYSDIAVFKPNGDWWIQPSFNPTGPPIIIHLGQAGDTPVPADYDGDGKADLAVFRSSTADWYLRSSAVGIVTIIHWGNPCDLPIPADYNGDGRADVAIYRNGNWWINIPGWPVITGLGAVSDEPVPHAYIQ